MSPYYPQSNGLAEAEVKQMKRLMKKNNRNIERFNEALLMWRNTTKEHGFTPAQLMFGFSQNFGQGNHA